MNLRTNWERDENGNCIRCGCTAPVHMGYCGEIDELRELLRRAADALQDYASEEWANNSNAHLNDPLAMEIKRKLKGD